MRGNERERRREKEGNERYVNDTRKEEQGKQKKKEKEGMQ